LAYPIKRYIPQDENDDYLIALALQTSSGYITSGDDDILSEKNNLERRKLVQCQQDLPGFLYEAFIEQFDGIPVQLFFHFLRVDGIILKDLL
jgi:predicted nucleic acid-binding protein